MKTPLHKIYGYAIGDGAVSLSMNGINNFALIYYTQVLGLGATHAGLALSLTIIWDAISDPIMGHLTDTARTRYGRRHPFLAGGGVLLAFSFFFLWYVPSGVEAPSVLFWYLLGVNLVVRTAVTIFMVPFIALGFEVCTDYDERSKLQGARFIVTQVVNFAGGALAWSLFFKDGVAADGSRIDGTKVVENYMTMNLWLTGAIAVFVCLVLLFTKGYAIDNRNVRVESSGNLRELFREFKDILTDRLGFLVISSKFIIQLGMMVVAQVQMFTYIEYMQFSHTEKTIAHGSGMLCFAAGSLLHSWLVKRYDKKPTAFIGMGMGAIGNGLLLLFFVGGLMATDQSFVLPEAFPLLGGVTIPVSVYTFAFLQSLWWGGMGLLAPLMLSMIADISEINYVKTGKLRDGGYSAIFSFFLKAATGIGMLFNGWLLERTGYISGLEEQSPGTLRNLAIVTFVAGPIALLPLWPLLIKYPVTRDYMKKIKKRREEMEAELSL